MAKITRIKAKDPGAPEKTPEKPLKKAPGKTTGTIKEAQKSTAPKDSANAKPAKSAEKSTEKPAEKSAKKAEKKPFILIRPFVYFGRYVRDSWREIRQVRWPSRKATWKLFFAILVYTALFIAVIMLLDALFTWLFETVIG